jgi:hypothetical protein
LGFTGKYTDDVYDTQSGWQNGNQWSVSFDAAYNYSEAGMLSAYATQQRRYRSRTDQRNLQTPTTATATRLNVPAYGTDDGTLTDDDFTVGLGFKQAKLMGGKLELVGDLTYSFGKTAYGTTFNYAHADTAGRTCFNAFYMTCGDLPDVKNTLTQFKLIGTYEVDKASKVALGYLFQRLHSTDYYYNGLQYGTSPTGLMPTNQKSGSYSLNAVSASYIYSFR